MTTHAILERTFDPPITVDTVLALARDTDWCFDLHKVDWHGSFLAADGRLMVCWFSAADLESARLALRKSGADLQRFWAGTVHDGPRPAVPNVLVERSFDSPVRLEEIQAREDAGAWCLEAHGVSFVRTLFSLDRKRMLCFYAAPDAEAVRLAQRKAEMPLEAVWSFTPIGPAALAGARA